MSMIRSMTGYGKAEGDFLTNSISVEIKSVNNRFKDIKFKMNYVFNKEEIGWRKIVESKIKRGSIDVFINLKNTKNASVDQQVDFDKVTRYLSAFKTRFPDEKFSFNPVDFLKTDFLQEGTDNQDSLIEFTGDLLEKALSSLLLSRELEGKKLAEKMREHLSIYNEAYQKVKVINTRTPEVLKEKFNQKLKEKLEEYKVDESRLLQEVIYYLEKLDVDEELNRIAIHLQKFHHLLSDGGELGKQLDFLLQELGRETNTLGSKTNSLEVSHLVVEMKLQLEKMREQSLNLE